MTIKNVAVRPMAVPATHVLVILAPAMDAIVNQTTTTRALVSVANANKERKF